MLSWTALFFVYSYNSCALTASGKTLLTMNDGKFTLKIDLDSDGKADACDASEIPVFYSKNLTT